jgi:hypothetical protein
MQDYKTIAKSNHFYSNNDSDDEISSESELRIDIPLNSRINRTKLQNILSKLPHNLTCGLKIPACNLFKIKQKAYKTICLFSLASAATLLFTFIASEIAKGEYNQLNNSTECCIIPPIPDWWSVAIGTAFTVITPLLIMCSCKIGCFFAEHWQSYATLRYATLLEVVMPKLLKDSHEPISKSYIPLLEAIKIQGLDSIKSDDFQITEEKKIQIFNNLDALIAISKKPSALATFDYLPTIHFESGSFLPKDVLGNIINNIKDLTFLDKVEMYKTFNSLAKNPVMHNL